MENLNRPTLIPGKLEAIDFDQLPLAEASTELGATQGDDATLPGRGTVLLLLLLALAVSLAGWVAHMVLAWR